MLDDLFKKETWDATPKIMKILNYCSNTMLYVGQEIATHKYWSVGIVVRSGGGPDNMLFDKSLHGKSWMLRIWIYVQVQQIFCKAMGITRGQFQIDYNFFARIHLSNTYLRWNYTCWGKTLQSRNGHIHQKKMVITCHCLGGETSSYKVVRAVRFARPCDTMLSRNTGAGPYNWFPDSLRVRNQVRPPRLGMSPVNWFPLKSLKYEQKWISSIPSHSLREETSWCRYIYNLINVVQN
jgi:hypothetical protein